jgi:hypothetical protein
LLKQIAPFLFNPGKEKRYEFPAIALKDILPGTVMILIGLLNSFPPRTLRLFHFYNSTSNYLLYQVATCWTWNFGKNLSANNLHILLVFRLVFCVASVTYPDMRLLMRLECEAKSWTIFCTAYLWTDP